MRQSPLLGTRDRRLFLIGALLAATALALGLWDVLVERDGGGWLLAVAFPAALLLLMLVRFLRSPRS